MSREMILVSKQIYDEFQQYKAKQKNDASTNTNDSREHFPLKKTITPKYDPPIEEVRKEKKSKDIKKKIMDKPRTKKEKNYNPSNDGWWTDCRKNVSFRFC